MINNAQNYAVSDILGIEANVKYVIPKYQREYVWRKPEWATLFDDLLENDPGYFLGSIICVRESNGDALKTQVLEVIDGQQRLASISLLYAAIYEWLGTKGELDEDLKHERFNLRYRLIVKRDKGQLKLEPSYQMQNYQDYLAILGQAGILGKTAIPKNLGNRRIHKTYKYFLDRLNEKDSKSDPIFSLSRVQDLLSKINAANLVKIEVNSHSDAFTLFESLNNRGVPLSAMDIIKNKLLAVLEKEKKGSIDDNFDTWNHLLENLTEDPTIQQRFLRQYYNTFRVDKNVVVKAIPRATRSNLIRIYETLINRNAPRLFSDLYEKSEAYKQLVVPENGNNSKELKKALLNLDRIGGAASYSLLMYILTSQKVGTGDMVRLVDFMVRYFLRRHLTDYPPTRDLDAIFMELIEMLHNKPSAGATAKRVIAFLKQPSICSGDSVFKEKLSGNIYEENSQAARFILCCIEEERQTKESRIDLWDRDEKNRFVWTVEHIFPQGANIPEKWVKEIAGGDAKKAKKVQEEKVHKLGNLTLSGFNSRLGNLSFQEKRDRKDSKGRHVGYKNKLFLNEGLNEGLRKRSSWTGRDIDARTKELVDLAMIQFKL